MPFNMLIAEGASLDGLVLAVQLFFLSTALPGLIGLLLCRRSKEARMVAFLLGTISILAGVCLLGWIISEHSSLPSFYFAAGTPLVIGTLACLFTCSALKSPGPPS